MDEDDKIIVESFLAARRPPPVSGEARIQRAAEIGDEIQLLDEKRAALWRSGIFFLCLLGVVTVLAAVGTGDVLFIGALLLLLGGVFAGYRMKAARLEAQKEKAEEEFAVLTSSEA
jgi:hypothetical protein